MLTLIVRGLLLVAGVATSWFVAKDAVNFSTVQMTVAVLLFTAVVFALAFCPAWIKKLGGRSADRS